MEEKSRTRRLNSEIEFEIEGLKSKSNKLQKEKEEFNFHISNLQKKQQKLTLLNRGFQRKVDIKSDYISEIRDLEAFTEALTESEEDYISQLDQSFSFGISSRHFNFRPDVWAIG